MKISIIDANLERDKQIIIDILNRNRNYKIDTGRYDWLYLNNPFGHAKIWLAVDEDENKAIGATAALPRQVWIKGKPVLCYVLSDFSVDKNYRSIGPALKLNRMSVTSLLKEENTFAYDFPSRQMGVLHRCMKKEPVGQIQRFIRPVRVDSQIEKKFKKGFIRKWFTVTGNTIVKVCTPQKIDNAYKIEFATIDSNSFDDSFTELDNTVSSQVIAGGVRNEAYLNWRYALNPLEKYYLVKLMHGSRLCAYAIFTFTNQQIQVYDLQSENSDAIRRFLIISLLRTAILKKAEKIEVSLLVGSFWIPLLKKYRFFYREDSYDIFVFAQKDCSIDRIVNLAGNWSMTLGDRDT